MLSVGDYIMKANEGVCRVDSTLMMASFDPDTKEVPYFLLVPVSNETVKIYIPVSGEYRDLRPVMCRTEAESLMDRIDSIEEMIVENDRQREQAYKDALRSLDPDRIIGILKSMSRRRRERLAEGKKVTAIDERYCKIAEETLSQELGFALCSDEEDVRRCIIERICRTEKAGTE